MQDEDMAAGATGVHLPHALSVKYPNCGPETWLAMGFLKRFSERPSELLWLAEQDT